MFGRAFLFCLLCAVSLRADEQGRAQVGPLRFQPLYSAGPAAEREVRSFRLDRAPVTVAEYGRFITENPEWRPGKAVRILADERYLASWVDGRPPATPQSPVTEVSYFAAAAFCEWRGGRLPKTLEWEAAAAASETRPDASRDPEYVQRILTWYAKPAERPLPAVASAKPNYWGIYDLHGLVWEWTEDFNSVFVSGDNRREGEALPNVFCGAGSESAADRTNYAAFMRYAFRSSLRGNFSLPTLGFRCAY